MKTTEKSSKKKFDLNKALEALSSAIETMNVIYQIIFSLILLLPVTAIVFFFLKNLNIQGSEEIFSNIIMIDGIFMSLGSIVYETIHKAKKKKIFAFSGWLFVMAIFTASMFFAFYGLIQLQNQNKNVNANAAFQLMWVGIILYLFTTGMHRLLINER